MPTNQNPIRPYQQGRTGGTIDRSTQMRRDTDEVVVPKITLYDIDFAVYYHLANNLNLFVIENEVSIQLPVMYANGEKWSQIRQHGYLRDGNKKVMAPLIVIRRTGFSNDERLPMPNLNNYRPTYKVLPYKTTSMQYDRIAGQYVSKESFEYYMVNWPNFIRSNYELLIWTDLQEQMNGVVQTIVEASDNMWGDQMTFRTNVQDISHENVNVPGEDRLVKSTITLQVDGALRNEYKYSQQSIQKAFSVKRVKFMENDSPPIISDTNPVANNTQNIADIKDVSNPNSLKKNLRL